MLDLEEFGDSFSDLAIEEYLNRGGEARRASGQQNHRHPVPRVNMITLSHKLTANQMCKIGNMQNGL